jgi:hypothetical protein
MIARSGFTRAGSRRLGVHRGVVAVIAVALSVVSVVGGGAPAGAVPATTPDVTDMTNGRVDVIVRAGGRIFIGGTFTAVGPTRGSMVTRSYLAALNASTGRLDPTWTTQTNGSVSALRASPDGQWLYIGGTFTSVRGTARSKVAKVSTATGSVASWNPGANAYVRSIATAGNRVFVAGAFTAIGGRSIPRLAAVNATTGAVDRAFQPRPNATPRSIDASTDGRVLAVGGAHTTIAGVNAPYLSTVNGTTGKDLGFRPAIGWAVWTLDLDAGGVEVYTGSNTNRVEAWRVASGRRGARWSLRGDGNVQAVAASATTVYFGGHFDQMAGQTRRHLAAVTIASGRLSSWTSRADSPYGVGAVAVDARSLMIGGEFDYVGGRLQMRFARFSGTT